MEWSSRTPNKADTGGHISSGKPVKEIETSAREAEC